MSIIAALDDWQF